MDERSSCITTMMPFHRPIPESKRRGKAGGSLPTQQAEERECQAGFRVSSAPGCRPKR